MGKIEENRHARFRRLAEARTDRVLDMLDLIGNLSNKSFSETFMLCNLSLSLVKPTLYQGICLLKTPIRELFISELIHQSLH